MADVRTEVWVEDIEEVLFAGRTDFLRKSVSHDQFVEDITVHVPQAGSLPGAQKNRTTFPAPIIKRADTLLDYDLDNYTIDPVIIRNLEEIQSSYAKRVSVMEQHMNILKDRMAVEGAFEWASNLEKNQILTTGNTTANIAPPGGTGNRKALTISDLARAATVLDEAHMPDDGRFMLIPPKLYYQLFTIQDLIRDDIMGEITLPPAVIKRVMLFNFIKRAGGTIYDNAGVNPQKKAVGAASANDDNFSAIGWHQSAVSAALGGITVFEDLQNPVMYGDVISAEVNFAIKKLRTDEAGIVTIIQAA